MSFGRVIAAACLALLAACAHAPDPSAGPPYPWESRLRGPAVVLLGEVHDNAGQHQLRLQVLRRAVEAGWRPAIVMEQLDTDRQADIERARRERPGDAQHLIDMAAPARSGWDWALYRGAIALALEFDLPLVAGNLSRGDARRLVREDPAAVFGPERAQSLGLTAPLSPSWQAAQEKEIEAGHCDALPAAALPGMARAQMARDAVMAEQLMRHAQRGAVLLAGNGHVRRDIGVPRWLPAHARTLAVGFLESDAGRSPEAAPFDAIVVTPRIERPDRCAAFAARPATSG